MSNNCGGWGKGAWGGGLCQTGPWGGIDKYAPQLLAMQPNCGDIDVNPAAPIIIKISDKGCAGLKLDCVRIYVNNTLAYSGSGLTIGVNQNNGFKTICDEECSDFSVSTDPVCGDSIWTIKLCCTNFGCDASVQLSATFCDYEGNIFKIGPGDDSASTCVFKTIKCNFIRKVEIIDNKRFVLRFANPMHGNPLINPDIYKPSSYTVTAVSGAQLVGNDVTVKSVLVEKSTFPRTVILETTAVKPGAMYEFVGKYSILDMYKQNLISKGKANIPVRLTKVNKMLENLPPMYNKAFDGIESVTSDSLSPYHLLAALGTEDEKIGGDF